MNLLEENMTPCVMMDRRTTPDGYGGYDAHWIEGAPIDCAIVMDTSMQAKIAEKQGVTSIYTVTTSRAINLQFYDVIKRLSDGKVFRVTSKGDEKKTPLSATLDMRQVSAEEWVLTDG